MQRPCILVMIMTLIKPLMALCPSMPLPIPKSNSFTLTAICDNAYKFGIVTNGLGIVRSICFYNQKFFDRHPKIIINKKSDSPDEDKSVHDARLLIPSLQDLFAAHPILTPHTFLGDAAFNSATLYQELLSGNPFGSDAYGNRRHFQKANIPLNSRADLENKDYSVNQDGIPCCPIPSTETGRY